MCLHGLYLLLFATGQHGINNKVSEDWKNPTLTHFVTL